MFLLSDFVRIPSSNRLLVDFKPSLSRLPNVSELVADVLFGLYDFAFIATLPLLCYMSPGIGRFFDNDCDSRILILPLDMPLLLSVKEFTLYGEGVLLVEINTLIIPDSHIWR